MAKAQATHTQPAKAAVGNPGTPMSPAPNKSFPAPPPAVPKKATKVMWAIAVVAGILVLSIAIGSVVRSHEQEESRSALSRGASIPLTTMPHAQWMKLAISPGNKGVIPLIPGMHPVVKGNGKFQPYTIYTDGTECAIGNDCPAKPQKEGYVVNEDRVLLTVIYAYAPD